ncbi:uncharacterized protein LOC127835101 isoform X4 [Dreissena polymorpha]|uniref:uncharacterized protein LOC127835101 isoform X4 n=1 Tax=Dreissena polymorpha TaxID=45954 RepID=UPI0022642988|nr:uncharacterized protein LOC127835101 isoform X4 [Dreissena polymorpha]
MATGGLHESNRGNASDFFGECAITQSCEPCMKANIAKAATVLCKDCNEYLCETCRNPHVVYKGGKHDVVSIQDKESSTVVVDMKGKDKCSEHGKGFEFYCEDHLKLCCTTCIIAHGKCDKWDEIASISRQKGAQLHGLKQSLLKLKSDADTIVAECKQTEEELNASIADLSKDLDEVKDRMIKLFDAAKRGLLTEANALKSEEGKKLSKMQSVTTNVMEELNQLLPMCSSLADHGTPQQMFIFSKQVEERNKTIESKINEQRMTEVSSKVTLAYTEELWSILEMGTKFMKVNLERRGNPSSISSLSQSRPVTLELIVSLNLPKSEDNEREPLLSGLDFLSDGRLVALDNLNKKCMILNEGLRRLGPPYTLKSYPKDVAVLSNSEIVVTCFECLLFLSVSSDNVISLTRQIKTSSSFSSICCKTPTQMVVSTSDDIRNVRMISVDGVETDFQQVEFPKKTYKLGDRLSAYVQSKNTLVLTDYYANTVYMYDTVKGTSVTIGNIQKPRSACVGPGDTVMVCSENKNSVVHLTVHGDFLGTYTVGMKYPCSICVSRDRARLAVSNCAIGDRKLQLYKILPTLNN